MLINNIYSSTVGISLRGAVLTVQVVYENILGLTVGKSILIKILLSILYSSLILRISGSTGLDRVTECLNSIVSTEESLHIGTLVKSFNSYLILVNQRLLSCNVSIKLIGCRLIIILDFLELLGSTEVKLVHLDSITLECLGYDNLIVGILLGSLGTEAEVRGLGINGMQTILTDVLLSVNEYPAFRILSSLGITLEVSTVDVPCTPVTILVSTGIVTCSQGIEEGIGLAGSTEDKISITLRRSGTAPLGGIYCYLLTGFGINFSRIQRNTVDKVTVEAIAPFTICMAVQQDVKALIGSIYHALDVADFSTGFNFFVIVSKTGSLTDSFIVKLTVL